MLAKGDGGQYIFVVVVVIFLIIRGVVEYFRRQKAEEEAKRKRLRDAEEARGVGASSTEEHAPGRERGKRPPRGLEALLEALAESEAPAGRREPEAPLPPERPEPRRAEHRGEVWDVDRETVEPSTRRLESGRETEAELGRRSRQQAAEHHPPVSSFEAYRAEREAETRRQQERARQLREETAKAQEVPPPRLASVRPRRSPVPEAAAGIAPAFARLAPSGKPPSVEDAQKGILWSVVLGRPRALSPYGQRGASDPPGGII